MNIIGARNTSLNSCKYAKRISRELGDQGHGVISLEWCEALILETITVMGNGVDIPYPLQNRNIYQTIKESSLI